MLIIKSTIGDEDVGSIGMMHNNGLGVVDWVMLMLVRSLVNRIIASLLTRFLGCHHQKRELAR